MATQQDEGGVPFSIAHQQQHFRLLELPPEIVELIDAPNPPLYVRRPVVPMRIPFLLQTPGFLSNLKPSPPLLARPTRSLHMQYFVRRTNLSSCARSRRPPRSS